MHQDTIGTVMITQEEINAKAAEIGQQIEKDFAGEEVVLIGILRGAVLWMGDIMKNVNLDMVIDFKMCIRDRSAAGNRLHRSIPGIPYRICHHRCRYRKRFRSWTDRDPVHGCDRDLHCQEIQKRIRRRI